MLKARVDLRMCLEAALLALPSKIVMLSDTWNGAANTSVQASSLSTLCGTSAKSGLSSQGSSEPTGSFTHMTVLTSPKTSMLM